jgi:hypothetical protein
MKHRRSLIAVGAGVAVAALSFGSLLASCADYSADRVLATGGVGTGGTTALGGQGTGGSTGGLPGTGGAATGGAGTGGAGTGGTPAAGGGAGLSSGGAAGLSSGGGAGVPGAGGAAQGGSAGASGAGGAGGGAIAPCDNPTNVTACGGDVVGTWNVGGGCMAISGEVDLSGLGTDCKSSPVTGTVRVTGTFTAKADGTYTDETMTTGQETLDLPKACLTLSGTETSCKRIGGPLKSVGWSAVTCVDNATTMGCTCTATVEQTGGLGLVRPSAPTSGPYTVADNVLSLSDGIKDTAYSFCVQGTMLTVSPPSMGKVGTSTGTISLQKQ